MKKKKNSFFLVVIIVSFILHLSMIRTTEFDEFFVVVEKLRFYQFGFQYI